MSTPRPRGRFQGVELVVPANYSGVSINFQDIPELRSDTTVDSLCFGFGVHSVLDTPTTWSGNPVASYAQLQAGFLTLYSLGYEKIFRVPLVEFLNIANDSSTYWYNPTYFETEPLRVDWTKSYVSFGAPLNNEAQFSYLFTVRYDWFDPGVYAQYLTNQNNQRALGNIKA